MPLIQVAPALNTSIHFSPIESKLDYEFNNHNCYILNLLHLEIPVKTPSYHFKSNTSVKPNNPDEMKKNKQGLQSLLLYQATKSFDIPWNVDMVFISHSMAPKLSVNKSQGSAAKLHAGQITSKIYSPLLINTLQLGHVFLKIAWIQTIKYTRSSDVNTADNT